MNTPRQQSLRIAFFPEYFYPHIGGAETWTLNIAKRLKQQGHQVEAYTYRMPGAVSDEVLSGVPIHRIGWPFVISGSRPYFRRFLIHALWSFVVLMRAKRFDVVLGQYTPLIPLRLVCEIRQTPLLAVFHDVYGLDSSFQQKGFLRGLIRYIFGDLLVTRLQYGGVIAVSQATKEKLLKIKCRTTNIAIIRNGVDIGVIDSVKAANRNPKQICYVGRLLKHKHLDDLLRAFPIVLRSAPNAELVVVGDGEERERLVSISHELGIEDSVIFTGQVDDISKIRLLKASKVLVLPSTQEGWGNVVTEAVSCGVAVISYAIPALKEQAEFFPSIKLVKPRDIDALADSIIKALSGNERLLEQDRLKAISHFSWEKSAEDLERFLYEAIQRTRTPRISSTANRMKEFEISE